MNSETSQQSYSQAIELLVHESCERLQERGLKVSLNAILADLADHGSSSSKGTVVKYRRTWEKNRKEQRLKRLETQSFSSALLEAIQKEIEYHRQLITKEFEQQLLEESSTNREILNALEQTEDSLEHLRKNHQQEIADFQQELKALEQKSAVDEMQLQQLKDQNSLLQAELEPLKKQYQLLKIEVIQKNSQFEKIQENQTILEKKVVLLKEQLKSSQKALTASDQRAIIAETRQEELRSQFQEHKTSWHLQEESWKLRWRELQKSLELERAHYLKMSDMMVIAQKTKKSIITSKNRIQNSSRPRSRKSK